MTLFDNLTKRSSSIHVFFSAMPVYLRVSIIRHSFVIMDKWLSVVQNTSWLYVSISGDLVCFVVLVLTIFNEVAYLTFKSIVHKALYLL